MLHSKVSRILCFATRVFLAVSEAHAGVVCLCANRVSDRYESLCKIRENPPMWRVFTGGELSPLCEL